MPALTMFEVTPDHPVPISPQGGTATVTVLSGDTLYYADTPQVSAANNQGAVTAGNVQSFTNPAWVRSASLSTVLAQVTAPTLPTASLPASVILATSPQVRMASSYLVPSGGDDSAAMANALTNFAPFASPVIALGPGTFQWNSQIPALLRNTPAKIQGAGVGKTIIQLSAAAPRAFDFSKVADYDVFTGIEMSDFTVDANNVGGHHHVVIGTYINGAITTRISVNQFAMRRVQTINVPSDATTANHRLNVWIVPQVNAADTPCTLNDHTYEDLDFRQGGNMGLVAGFTSSDTASAGTYARISGHRIKHDTGLSGQGSFSSSSVQIGSHALGTDWVKLDEIEGANTGDVIVEVDSCPNLHIGMLQGKDPVNTTLLLVNLGGYAVGSAQLPTQIARVDSLRHQANVVGSSQALQIGSSFNYGNIDIGSLHVESNIVTGTHPTVIRSVSCASLDIGHVHYAITRANDTTTSTLIWVMSVRPQVDMTFRVRSYTEALAGTYSAGQIKTFEAFDAGVACNLDLKIDSMLINNAMTLLHHQSFVQSTPATGTLTFTGYVRGLRVKQCPAVLLGGIYFVLPNAAAMPTPFLVDSANFTGMAGVGNGEIYATVAGTASKAPFLVTNTRYQDGSTSAPIGAAFLLTATNATWPIPKNAQTLEIVAVGGGGGGGGGGSSSAIANQTGGGGGTSGSAASQVVPVGTNTTLNVQVGGGGAGGNGGAAGGAAGTDGAVGGNTNVTGTGFATVRGYAGGQGRASAANSAANVGTVQFGSQTSDNTILARAPEGGRSGQAGAAALGYAPSGAGGGGSSSATLGGGPGGAGGNLVGTGGGAGASATTAGVAGTAATVPGAGGGGGGGGSWNGGTGPGAGGAGGAGASGFAIVRVVG